MSYETDAYGTFVGEQTDVENEEEERIMPVEIDEHLQRQRRMRVLDERVISQHITTLYPVFYEQYSMLATRVDKGVARYN
jgi:hypothetical protein